MTLGFSLKINDKPTRFVHKIWSGLVDNPQVESANALNKEQMHLKYFRPSVEKGYMGMVERLPAKIHTIRADKKGRWKPGNKIHFVVKNRTPDRFQFAPVLTCTSIQKIEIRNIFDDRHAVIIDGRELSEKEILMLSVNDGFESVDDFWNYFVWEDFEGVIIHWTDLTY